MSTNKRCSMAHWLHTSSPASICRAFWIDLKGWALVPFDEEQYVF
jgi:hypothetical protein